MAVAANPHRPAAQIIRELMSHYIAKGESPSALTAETIRKAGLGDDVFHASSPADLFSWACDAFSELDRPVQWRRETGRKARQGHEPAAWNDHLLLTGQPRCAMRSSGGGLRWMPIASPTTSREITEKSVSEAALAFENKFASAQDKRPDP